MATTCSSVMPGLSLALSITALGTKPIGRAAARFRVCMARLKCSNRNITIAPPTSATPGQP